MKKLFYGLLIAAALVGGIAGLVLDKVSVDIPEDVVENLNTRYPNNESFEFVGYVEDENTTNSRVMIIKGKNGEFKLTRYYDTDGVVHYNDNYLGVTYINSLAEHLEDIFDKLDIKFKLEIDLDDSAFPDETKNTDLIGKVLSSYDALLKVNVITPASLTDADISRLVNVMSSNGLVGNISFSVLQSGLNDVKFSDFDSVMRSGASDGKRTFFSVDSDYNISYINRE